MKIFLSHTSSDKPAVRHVGAYLEEKGFSVWLDEWEMTPGDSLINKISEGIESSDKLVVFLSPESISSEWVEKEINGGVVVEIAKRIGLGSKFVIPVMLAECRVPFFLREKLYANFTNKPFADACEELLSGIESKPRPRIMEPYSNAVVNVHEMGQDPSGKFVSVIEFTTNLSPISGIAIQVLTSGYTIKMERVGPSGTPVIPQPPGKNFLRTEFFSDGKMFRRSFQEPSLKKGISYYLLLAGDHPIEVKQVKFTDYYGQDI